MSDDIDTTEAKVEVNEAGDETAVYELGYHILSSVGEEGLPSEVSNIKGILEKKGGVFISEEFPVLTRLAYTMVRNVSGKKEKYDTAYFGWIKFEMSPSELHTVKEGFDASANILRFILVHTVRESTRVPKHVLLSSNEGGDKPTKPVVIKKPKKEEDPKEEISIDEIDRTIEELVVE